MKMSILWIAVIALCFCHNSSGELPASIQKCRVGDVKCIVKVINAILRNHPASTAELGLTNLEPVHIDELIVTRTDGANPLSLDMKFVDLDIYGLSKLTVNRAVGFEKDPLTSKFELYMTIPEVILRGKYETNGKILLLPITGKGNAEAKLLNMKSDVKVKVDATNKNGKIFLSIQQMKVKNEPELVTVQLDNLFNGNKELGDELNSIMNANWKEIWVEMEDGINEAYTEIVKTVIDQVFKKVTYDEFYLNE